MSTALDTQALHAIGEAVSPSYRLQNAGITIDGGDEINFSEYPFIPPILDSRKRLTTVIKGAQLGLSIALILWLLCLARDKHEGKLKFPLRGLAYWMPTAGEALSFSKARFTPLMEQNEHYWNPADMDVSSADLKRYGTTAIYLRGAGQRGGPSNKSTSAVKSMPIDAQAFDEYDEMDPSRVDAIHHRLDGSKNPMEMMASTPTVPGHGVDLDYQASDQSSWLWRCTHCNEYTCLEDHFPDCIAQPTNKDPFYLCMKCREPIVREYGEMVARKPDITDHTGVWVSQLCSPRRTALDIVNEEKKARDSGRMREYYNQVLARAYADVEDQITEAQLNELVRNDPKPLTHEGPAAMGVDPGKIHWYDVRVRISDKDSIQIARGRADSYEELSAVARRYNVKSGVMDKGYDPSAVARFCNEHPGWFGCLYVNKKGDADWNAKTKEVKAGRTRLLDDAHNDIVSKRVSFYQRDEFWHDEFVPQMTNLKRTTLENDQTGAREAMWVVTGGKKNDHLRHANAYSWLASQRVGIAKSIQDLHTRSRRQERAGARRRSRMTI